MTHGLTLGQKSGLAPETSLALAEQLISHPLVLERLQKAADLLNTGYAFFDALKESRLFGGMEIRLIVVAFQYSRRMMLSQTFPAAIRTMLLP